MNRDNLIPDYLYSKMSAISARTDWLTYWQGLVQKTILCQNCERITIYTNISKQLSPSHDQSPVPTQVRFNQIALWASLCFLQIHQLPWVLTKLSNRTRFQLILQVDSQNVTKNRTDHRMHVKGPQICQINRWNNSFQNMYGMNRQQLTVWPGKLILCKKNTYKTFFVCARIWVTWLWKDLDAKRLTPGQLLGCPWKLWGITLQTS